MIVVSLQLPILLAYVKQDEIVLQETDRVATNRFHHSCHGRDSRDRPHSDQALIAIGPHLVSEVEKLRKNDDQQNRQIAIAAKERFHWGPTLTLKGALETD